MTTKWAIVPVEPADQMMFEGDRVLDDDCYAAMLTASPGADLLERIVSTLNDASIDLWGKGMNTTARKVDAILDELGGGNGN